MSSTLYTPRTEEQLRQQAESEVNQSVGAQTAPLQRESESLMGREGAALGQIGSMFDQLQPVVTKEADAVSSSYDAANDASRSIFEAAKGRLDQLANERAQRAQALSQQMGGPVAVGEFTAGVEPGRTLLAEVAPNQLLHGLANAEAGKQLARAYSERVFPALRTETTANARGYFEDQIKDLRKQMDQINSQSSALKSNRLSELLTQERNYSLQQEQLKLDKLKADRDWEATQRTLHNEDTRINLAKKQFGLSESGVTGKYKGKPTQQSIKLAVEQRLAAQRLGLSVAQYKERVRHNLETEATAKSREGRQNEKNAMAIIDAATGRTKGGTVTTKVYYDDVTGAMQLGKSGVHYNPKAPKGQRYYKYETRHLTPQQMERTYGSGYGSDPQALYDLLIGSNIPKAVALKLVKTRTGISSFTPGGTVSYKAADLAAIGKRSFNELRGIAISRGFKPNPKHPTNTQGLIDFIMGTNP